jgi:hypothetical protein
MTVLLMAMTVGLGAPPAVDVDATATATPHHTFCRSGRLHSRYIHLYRAVRRENGPRAPGRNIWDEGLRPGDPSRCRDVRRSAAVLKRIHFPGVRLLTPSLPTVPPAGIPTPRATSAPLTAIRACESTNDYQAVNATNPNRPAGGYQIITSTWLANGGGKYAPTADAASPAQQDEIASSIYAREGSKPWACKP